MDEYIKNVLESKDHVGVKLKKIIDAKGVSHFNVARGIGISYSALARFEETGAVERAVIDFKKISKIVGVPEIVSLENLGEGKKLYNNPAIISGIKSEMKKADMSINALAKGLNISVGTVSGWLNGHLHKWTETRLREVLSVLNVNYEDFMKTIPADIEKNNVDARWIRTNKFIGARIKEALSEKHMSYEQFASAMNWSNPNFVGRVVNGEIRLSKTTMKRILEIFEKDDNFFRMDTKIDVTDDMKNKILYGLHYKGVSYTRLNELMNRDGHGNSIVPSIVDRGQIDLEDVQQISTILGVTPEWIMGQSADDSFYFPSPQHIRDIVVELQRAFRMSKEEFKNATGIDKNNVCDRSFRSGTIYGEDIVNKICNMTGLEKDIIIDGKLSPKELCKKIVTIINVPGLKYRILERCAYIRKPVNTLANELSIKGSTLMTVLKDETLVDFMLKSRIDEFADKLQCSTEYLLCGTPDPYTFKTYDDLSAYFGLLRFRAGLSTSEAAKRLGVTTSTITSYETSGGNAKSGKRKHMTNDTIVTVCKLYGVDTSDIIQRCSKSLIDDINAERNQPVLDKDRVEFYNTNKFVDLTRKRIREARGIRGFSLKALAGALGYKWGNAIRDFENGKTFEPHFSLEACAKVLDVPLSWLLGGDETPFPTDADKELHPAKRSKSDGDDTPSSEGECCGIDDGKNDSGTKMVNISFTLDIAVRNALRTKAFSNRMSVSKYIREMVTNALSSDDSDSESIVDIKLDRSLYEKICTKSLSESKSFEEYLNDVITFDVDNKIISTPDEQSQHDAQCDTKGSYLLQALKSELGDFTDDDLLEIYKKVNEIKKRGE